MQVESGRRAGRDGAAAGLRVLVADDDDRFRRLLAELLLETDAVGSVVEARDGAVAVELGRDGTVDAAVLDLLMPRLDGIAAARALLRSRPSLPVALQSSDTELLRFRAEGLALPLFDKARCEELLAWVERRAAAVRRG